MVLLENHYKTDVLSLLRHTKTELAIAIANGYQHQHFGDDFMVRRIENNPCSKPQTKIKAFWFDLYNQDAKSLITCPALMSVR